LSIKIELALGRVVVVVVGQLLEQCSIGHGGDDDQGGNDGS